MVGPPLGCPTPAHSDCRPAARLVEPEIRLRTAEYPRIHHHARCPPAGDLELIERVYRVLCIGKTEAAQQHFPKKGRSIGCDFEYRPTFAIRAQIEW